MNKRDIKLELEDMIRELMSWQTHLEPMSEALAQLFRDQIVYISNKKPSNFDDERIFQMMGKVRGMVAAAAVLFDEWNRHHGGGAQPS